MKVIFEDNDVEALKVRSAATMNARPSWNCHGLGAAIGICQVEIFNGGTMRKTIRSSKEQARRGLREFWFDQADKERILFSVFPRFQFIAMTMGLRNVPKQATQPSGLRQIISLAAHPPDVSTGEYRFVLPNYSFQKTEGETPDKRGFGRVDGKPIKLKRAFPELLTAPRKSEVDFVHITIPALKSRKEASHHLARAQKALTLLGLDERFQRVYMEQLTAWLAYRFRRESSRVEKDFFASLDAELELLRGEALWLALSTDPVTHKEDPVASAKLTKRCKASAPRLLDALSLSAKSRADIIRLYCTEAGVVPRHGELEKMDERLRSSRKRRK